MNTSCRCIARWPISAFAFLLGSGASKSSGIPTGGELVQQWLCKLHRQLDPEAGISRVEEWATSDHLGIPGFEFARAPEFYPQVYEQRFGRDLEQGYAAIEHVMQDAEPSLGYSILAHILATERHWGGLGRTGQGSPRYNHTMNSPQCRLMMS